MSGVRVLCVNLILHGIFCGWVVAQSQQPEADMTAGGASTTSAAINATTADRPWANDAAVRQQVEKGISLVNAKQFKEAVDELTAAARKYPQDGMLRHLLGFAMFQNKQAGPAWLQFRAAVRLALSHEPAVRDFLSMWSVFDQQGILNSGRSMEYITKALGNPDRKIGADSKQVWEYGFMRLQFNNGQLFAVVDPRGLDPSDARPIDALRVEFDEKDRWRLGYRIINRLQSLAEYVPRDESVQKWNELLSVQRLYPKQQATPEQMMKEIKQNLQKANPNVDFKALLVEEGDVLFHWRDKGDKSQNRPPQHEIVRLVAGEKDVHRLAYARRVAQIPTNDARAWIEHLRGAQLIKVAVPNQKKPVETARK